MDFSILECCFDVSEDILKARIIERGKTLKSGGLNQDEQKITLELKFIGRKLPVADFIF